MKGELSNEFKKFFLMKFTEELIKQSEKKDITKLQGIIESKERGRRERLIPIQKKGLFIERGKSKKNNISFEEIFNKPQQIQTQIRKQITRQITNPSLFIPEPKLPSYLEYLKPIPKTGIEIDLWKLNPLIKDQAVRIIEGNPDEKVKVTGTMGTKQTSIVLNKEDIDRIVGRFSELSKIPITEGIYKVVVGNLILSAIISTVIGSRFIIKKMVYNNPRQQYPSPSFTKPPITMNNLR